MLAELRIKNLALIDELNLTFSKGLTVLSGETGAGKTIVIEALNLLLGGRGDSSRVRSGSSEASVQGLFILPPKLIDALEEFTNSRDELLLSRKLTAEGKSRCHINGELATVSQLAEVGALLVDIHGQHEHQSLFKVPLHLEYLDHFAGPTVLAKRADFEALLKRRQELVRQAAALAEAEKHKDERRDLLTYQINEIEAAAVQIGEDVRAEAELERVRRHERLTAAVSTAYTKLAADEVGGLDQVQLADKELTLVADFDPVLTEVHEQLTSVSAQLEDIIGALRRYQEDSYYDAKRLDWLEERVHLLRNLKSKYGGSLEAVRDYRRQAKEELDRLIDGRAQRDRIEDDIKGLTADLQKLGQELSGRRRQAAVAFEKNVRCQLRELAMTQAKFAVIFESRPEEPDQWRPSGFDNLEFFISPNKGEKMMPLAKIASGGEISRVMLALKTVLAKVDGAPLMVFDEIDAGIGGKTAVQVGVKLASLAAEDQIICVTHLPQIAVYADYQFNVSKIEKDGRTVTIVKSLSREERISEITRMSGAEGASPSALKHIRELMKAAEEKKAGVVV